jgi:hypothetical protein
MRKGKNGHPLIAESRLPATRMGANVRIFLVGAARDGFHGSVSVPAFGLQSGL